VNRKKKKKTQSRQLVFIYLGLMLAFIVELLFYTYCRVQSTQVSVDISNERARYEELESLRDSLKVELARLKSPKRIAKIAGQQFGLVMPESNQIVVLE
jgi:cell division protein FtsL